MLADGDPIATELFDKYKNVRMPHLALSHAEVAAVVEYLVKQDAAIASATPPAPRPRPIAAAAIVDPYLRIQEALSADTRTGITGAARRLARAAGKPGARGR